jgi:hypothetical protein
MAGASVRRLCFLLTVVAAMLAVPRPALASEPTPLLAYYYLWFDPSSWDRAKTDYPTLGRYSSDDPQIMRQHIAWAKSAGIEGFVVSWRDTPTNNRRLRLLMDVARGMDFRIAMIYQGLDFQREPRAVAQVQADFITFRDRFADDPVILRLGGKALTIFSGTWRYSHDDIRTVTAAVRSSMLVLSTEKSVEGYQRLADVTDGDAYYWSSVDVDTNTYYEKKLHDMSTAVHRDGHYWMAPFAPGFDARLVGGTRSIDRKDGQTLRQQYTAAVSSSPDVLGLISWNEFSENSYVEPSQAFGSRYLDVLRDLTAARAPNPPQATDSSDTAVSVRGRLLPNVVVLAVFPLILIAVVVGITVHRRRRQSGRNTS